MGTPDPIVFTTERPNHTLGDSGEAMISVLAGRKYTGILRLSPAVADGFIAMVDSHAGVVRELNRMVANCASCHGTGKADEGLKCPECLGARAALAAALPPTIAADTDGLAKAGEQP